MKKVILALGILLMSFSLSSTAYAGSLNAYENEIIEAAQKIYPYNGLQYRVDPDYLTQLIEYLSRDDIDLNAEDRDLVLQTAYGSVETGVREGYLVPMKAEDTQAEITPTQEPSATVTPSAEDPVGSSSEDTPVSAEADLNNPAEDISGDSNTEASDKGQSADTGDTTVGTDNAAGTIADNIANTDNAADTIAESVRDTGNSDGKKVTPPEVFIEEILDGEQSTVDMEENIFDLNSNIASVDNSIIKDTGFNFSNTILMIAGMGMLMLAGIIVTVKSNFFAQTDE